MHTKEFPFTPLPKTAAAFTIIPEGRASVRITRYQPVASCAGQPSPACIACGGSFLQAQSASAALTYGAYQQPLGVSAAAFTATLTALTGFQAKLAWDGGFPRNMQGNSSDARVAGWLAYLPGLRGDTGRVVTDAAADSYAFYSEGLPEGGMSGRDVGPCMGASCLQE